MNIDEFWKKYNHCPFCEGYHYQGNRCYGCKWLTPYPKETDFDLFYPSQEGNQRMNKEITDWR